MTERDKKNTTLTPQQAKIKAENYCVYQERSQQEVRDKLYSWGLHRNEVENLLVDLIENNFLNEERFAQSYASGKFRMKGWGKYKIIQGLKAKKVSKPLIKTAISTINTEEYHKEIQKQAENKIKTIKSEDLKLKKQKLYSFLLSKGYENEIIIEIIKKIT